MRAAMRVVAEAEPLHHARGDRDDVLQRRPDLHADDVGRRVEAEEPPAELRLHERRGGHAEAAQTAVGSSLATSRAKLGPDSTTTGWLGPTSCAMTSDGPKQRVGLESFRRADDRGRRKQHGAAAQHAA